jgi:hypothetical protein
LKGFVRILIIIASCSEIVILGGGGMFSASVLHFLDFFTAESRRGLLKAGSALEYLASELGAKLFR